MSFMIQNVVCGAMYGSDLGSPPCRAEGCRFNVQGHKENGPSSSKCRQQASGNFTVTQNMSTHMPVCISGHLSICRPQRKQQRQGGPKERRPRRMQVTRQSLPDTSKMNDWLQQQRSLQPSWILTSSQAPISGRTETSGQYGRLLTA